MIAFTLLLSLSVAAGSCTCVKGAEKHTPAAPKLNKITSFGGPPFGIRVKWQPVQFHDTSLNSGYKVKMWANKKVPVKVKVGNVWKTKYIPEQSLHAMPSAAPVEQMVGVYQTTALFEDVELDVDYQIRVQAFDGLRHGPYSNVLGVKLLAPDKTKEY